MEERSYYEAYDDRYRQVHAQNLRWFSEDPSPIVMETIREFQITKSHSILEIGCGEGRDAVSLLREGYDLLATDVSAAAIDFCRKENPEFTDRFQIVDCLKDTCERKFDFIYAIAVVHMLVPDKDRHAFYRFIRQQLTDRGTALIGTMGNGEWEHSSDISTAFSLQERLHEQTGKTVHIAGTSYRAVSFESFQKEIREAGLQILKEGVTAIKPDYHNVMYAVVKPSDEKI